MKNKTIFLLWLSIFSTQNILTNTEQVENPPKTESLVESAQNHIKKQILMYCATYAFHYLIKRFVPKTLQDTYTVSIDLATAAQGYYSNTIFGQCSAAFSIIHALPSTTRIIKKIINQK